MLSRHYVLTLINTTGDSALLRVILQPAQWILAQTVLTRNWCYNNLIENLDYKDWGNSQPQLILIYNFGIISSVSIWSTQTREIGIIIVLVLRPFTGPQMFQTSYLLMTEERSYKKFPSSVFIFIFSTINRRFAVFIKWETESDSDHP